MMNMAQPDDLSNLAQSLEDAFNDAQTNAQSIISELDNWQLAVDIGNTGHWQHFTAAPCRAVFCALKAPLNPT